MANGSLLLTKSARCSSITDFLTYMSEDETSHLYINKEGEKRGGVPSRQPVVKMARKSLKERQILGKGDIRLSSKEKRVLVEKGATS